MIDDLSDILKNLESGLENKSIGYTEFSERFVLIYENSEDACEAAKIFCCKKVKNLPVWCYNKKEFLRYIPLYEERIKSNIKVSWN